MTEHICKKEKEIDEMHEMLVRIDEGLRGNGKAGLFTEFAVLKNTVVGLVGLNILIVSSLVVLWISK